VVSRKGGHGRELAAIGLVCVTAHALALVAWPGGHGVLRADQRVAATPLIVRTLAAPPAAPRQHPDLGVEPPAAQVARAAAKPSAKTGDRATANKASVSTAPPDFDSSGSTYWPADDLEVRPVPRSAPDALYVQNEFHSGLPIRLRLYIERDGNVSSTELISASDDDQATARQVMAMFQATGFVPGRREGRDVAAFFDIEIVLDAVPAELIGMGL
jgi:hypothetical protein